MTIKDIQGAYQEPGKQERQADIYGENKKSRTRYAELV